MQYLFIHIFHFVDLDEIIFTEEHINYMKKYFENLRIGLINKDIPTIISEFGTKNGQNNEERVKHVKSYSSLCHKMNIPIIWWDNGSRDQYAIFDRNNLKFIYEDISTAMINEYDKNVGKMKTSEKNIILFNGYSEAEDWSKAVKIVTSHNSNGIFEETLINENGYFLIEISSKNANDAYMILQSWGDIPIWESIEAGLYFKKNYNFILKFYYKDMVDKFGDDFSLLDAIYISSRRNRIIL